MAGPSTSAQSDRAAPFFTDEAVNCGFRQVNNLTDAKLFGCLKKTAHWQPFLVPGEADPGYLEFQTRVVPRVTKFIFGYQGFTGLRWMLGQVVSGLRKFLGAKHVATTSVYDGTDQPYREHVALLDVIKVGSTQKGKGKGSRNVVEAGDFIFVARPDKKQIRKVVCQVKNCYVSLVDGLQWLLVQPVRALLHAHL
jgi:hypothetical protein